jgi:hypothetical protein
MQKTIDSLQAKLDEQKQLLRTLAMWAKVQEQGINPDDVKSFGFDPALMTAQERNEARRANRLNYTTNNPYGWPISRNEEGQARIIGLKHNFVRLHSGEKVKLSPMVDRP